MKNVPIAAIVFTVLIVSSCESTGTESNARTANTASAAKPNTDLPVPTQNTNLGSANMPVIVGGNHLPETTNKATTKPAKSYEQVAPEDSMFSVELTDVGIETRTFMKHAVIAKVEKRFDSNGSKVIIFLKNGKRKEIDAVKIPDLKNALSSDILAAAGLSLPVIRSNRREAVNSIKKKSEN